jgi:hypothetical protein
MIPLSNPPVRWKTVVSGARGAEVERRVDRVH